MLAILSFISQPLPSVAQPLFSFDDIEFWVGTGANRSAVVIDWVEDTTEPPALAWGYRWDGEKTGRDMLLAVIAADPRLFAKVGFEEDVPNGPGEQAVYGLGYDADGDGIFGVCDFLDEGVCYAETAFNDDGIAFTGAADGGTATDAGDYYAEGWFLGFWHYGVEQPGGTNPYGKGSWSDAGGGMVGRDLVDGSWDSWTFTPAFDFTSFAENPTAAPLPYPTGDYNRSGHVDAADYNTWRASYGSTSLLDADGNRNGIVDAADFVIWRDSVSATASANSIVATGVPEPTTALLLLIAFAAFQLVYLPTRVSKETANVR